MTTRNAVCVTHLPRKILIILINVIFENVSFAR